MLDFIRNHIVSKTILTIALCLAIVSVLSASILYFSYKRKLLNDYNQEIRNIQQIIEGSYATHLWNIQPESIRSLNETVLSAGQYLAINIFDKELDGSYLTNCATRKIYSNGLVAFTHATEPVVLENRYFEASGGFFEYQGSVIGKYELYHTNAHIYDHLKEIVYTTAATLIAFTFGVTIILVVLLNRFVIRKLFSLVDFAKKMAREKKYDQRLSTRGNDEVSVLACAINDMLEQIEYKDHEKDQANRKLSQSESYLQSILDAAPDAIFIHEAKQGTIIDVNNSACSMFRCDRGYLVGKDLGVISSGGPSYNVRDVSAWMRKARNQGPQRFEWLSRKADGSVFWTEIDVRFAQIRGDSCFLVLARDITQRKQAEETILERERQLRTLSDNLPGGYVYQLTLSRGQRRCTYISAGVEEVHGVSADDVMKDVSILYSRILDEDQQIISGQETFALDSMSRFNAEVRYRAVSGEIRWLMLVAAPRSLSDDTILLDGIAIDITAQKEAKEQKEKLQSQLFQAQKIESVGMLAGGIAHDFNNLLQTLQGNIELLVMDEFTDSRSKNRLKRIVKSLDRAARLVQQLLLFSRKAESRKVKVDVNLEIREVARILERTIPKMISLDLHLDPAVRTISGDPVQIEQILLNLANNAVDAMQDNGKLVMKTRNVMLDEDFVKYHPGAAPGPHVLLRVTDTGCGMDEQTRKQIFDPFFTTKEVGKGTGLGLASVYGIVKAHGGYILCYSEPEQGTVFSVYLPALGKNDLPTVEKQTETDSRGGSECILVVDDEPEIREITRELLESRGYTVKEAENGEEAVRFYQEHGQSIDLVLLDLNMPGMGGHKCLQALLQIHPGARVIIASGYSADGQAGDALSSGARDFIGKPYQFKDLTDTVRKVLDMDD